MTIAILEPDRMLMKQLVLRIKRLCGDETVLTASSAGELLTVLDGRRADMAFVQAELPDTQWATLCGELRLRQPQAEFVLMADSDAYALEAIHLHIHDYLLTPIDDSKLLHAFTELETYGGAAD